MKSLKILTLLLVSLFGHGHAAPWLESAHSFTARDAPNLPSQDPFYIPPEGFESAEPGTILRHRPPPSQMGGFASIPLNLEHAYQLLYRTTDAVGNATATVLTIMIPHNADFEKLLSYQTAEDAANIDCAPSYIFQKDHGKAPPGTGVTESEQLLLVASVLEQGWVGIIPDYLGRSAAYSATALAGHAALDGVRAAINSASLTGISKNPTVALWGYSGGSVPCLSAAELRATYASEIDIAGVATGGVISNLTELITKVNKTPHAGIVAATLIGLTHQYPRAKRVIDQNLLPQHRARFYHAGELCYEQIYKQYENEDVLGYFDNRDLIYTDPTLTRLLAENRLGKRAPDVPVYVYEAISDQVVDSKDADQLVRRYCEQGAQVEYQREILANHETTAILTLPKTITWLKDRFDKKALPGKCVRYTKLTTLLDISTVTILPKFVIDAILDLLSKPVGPVISSL